MKDRALEIFEKKNPALIVSLPGNDAAAEPVNFVFPWNVFSFRGLVPWSSLASCFSSSSSSSSLSSRNPACSFLLSFLGLAFLEVLLLRYSPFLLTLLLFPLLFSLGALSIC